MRYVVGWVRVLRGVSFAVLLPHEHKGRLRAPPHVGLTLPLGAGFTELDRLEFKDFNLLAVDPRLILELVRLRP